MRSVVLRIASEADLLRLKKIARAHRLAPRDVEDIAFLEARPPCRTSTTTGRAHQALDLLQSLSGTSCVKEQAAELKRARKAVGWTQAQAAARLGLSQGYVSLLESGKRRVPERLLPRLRRELGLSATALPARESNLDPGSLPGALAALGYEPFGYLRGRSLNPAELLLAALRQSDLPARVVEGLPWLVLRHPDLDWKWLVEHAKVHDVQNRLAYVLALAREVAEGRDDVRLAARFQKLLADLERSRLAREDTLCRDSMTRAERRFLRERRPALARHWNLLTGLSADQLPYAA